MPAAALFETGTAAAHARAARAELKRVLVVTTTVGYRHSSIETAAGIIGALDRSSGGYDARTWCGEQISVLLLHGVPFLIAGVARVTSRPGRASTWPVAS